MIPVANNDPPVVAAYHLMVPLPVADSVTVPFPHLDALVPVGDDGTSITIAVTAVLVAETQPVEVIESNV